MAALLWVWKAISSGPGVLIAALASLWLAMTQRDKRIQSDNNAKKAQDNAIKQNKIIKDRQEIDEHESILYNDNHSNTDRSDL